MNLQTIRYRLKYLHRAVWLFFGLCHRCNNRLNHTSKGRPICPLCGR